ncbi:MAG: sensor histidine kinase [Clostridiales bacterium]|jgi:signal transduction histidine kinase|nr:sensor histidine kinase [Clostridiales bacterium]
MKKHRNSLYIFVFLAAILVMWSSLIFIPDAEEVRLPVVEGSHDLSAADFENTVYLSKDYWESWPERLYTPEDFASGAVTEPPRFLESDDFTRIQFATHRLTLRLPPGKTYGLSMTTSDFAMRLFIDSVEIDSVGIPGATREETVPRVLKKEYYFSPQAETVELVVQASNFVHRQGAWYPGFTIGSLENIASRAGRDVFLSALIFGCLIAMALDHMSLFVLNRKWKSALLFSICCFLMAMMSSKKFLFLFFPHYNWFVGIRVEYIVHFAVFFMLTLFLHTIFPKLYHKPVLRAYLALCGLFCLTLFWDALVFTSLIKYFEYASAAMIAYTLFRLALAAIRERKTQNALALLGVSGVCFLALNDMLYHQGIGRLGPIAGQEFTVTIGMMFFAVCCSLLISVEFTETERAMLDARENEARLAVDNEALNRVNRMKSELMATVTHETRTPLAILSGYAELISMEMRRKGVDEQTAQDLDGIAEEALRLSAIMDEAQDFARSKDAAVRREWIRLADVIHQCARLYKPILARKHTVLTLELPDDLPPVFACADELTQVLFNLLQNARNHTEHGEVSIRARVNTPDAALQGKIDKDGLEAEICVSDTGTGITPEFLPRAFERGAHDDPAGSGIGLAICRDIIAAHGGRIWIDSAAGKGTTVTFTLPIQYLCDEKKE